MASGSFYNYPVGSFGLYCTWSSTVDSTNNRSEVTLKTYLSYYTLDVVARSDAYTIINGSKAFFNAPAIDKETASSYTKQLIDERKIYVKHNSDGKKSVTLSAGYPFYGYYSDEYIDVLTVSKTVTLDNIITKCKAPDFFTAYTDNDNLDVFETSVNLDWEAGTSGIGNTITQYEIQYRVKSNSTWGSFTALGTTSKTNCAIDMSSKVKRGEYVQFRIRTQGSAGSSYYSGWVGSVVIQRQPYTPCEAPTSFTVTPNPFEDIITFVWSGAKAGTDNTISSYYIQYSTTQDNITWDDWVGLKTVSSTSTSGSYSMDLSSKVLRGKNVRFRIRTQGSAGSSFYSGYKTYSYITRQAYTKCEPPVDIIVTDTNPDSTSTFEIALAWSDAKSGILNTISSYCIWYATSSNNSTWNSWKELTLISSTATSGNKSFDMTAMVSRGEYVKFRIQVQGSAGSSFYSDYKETSSIRRNPYTNCSAPTSFQIISDRLDSSKTYNEPFETKVTLKWQGAISGASNTISGYDIYCAINESTNSNLEWNYQLLTSVASTKTEGTQELNMTSLVKSINATLNNGTTKALTEVPRTYYVRFQIVTKGSANSLYYSDKKTATYVQSNGGTTFEIRRNPYTKCLPPTTIDLKSEANLENKHYCSIFESQIIAYWSGADNGENNPITGYEIDYRISDDKQNWGIWKTYSTLSSIQTSYEYTMCEVTEHISRGQYVQFRVKTLGTASGYDSDYIESLIMCKNKIPDNVSYVKARKTEYSYDKGITVYWNEPKDEHIYKYEVIVYQNINGVYTKILTTEVDRSIANLTLNKDNTYKETYKKIKNNQQIKFAVKPIDGFGVPAEAYIESSIITRYDDTGVCIGIDGQWIPCQFYVGVDGQWVEQTVSAGVNSGWSQCGVE